MKKLILKKKLQVNKRMKAKLGRGLIRPEATLDLHGYNRLEAEKTLKGFHKYLHKPGKEMYFNSNRKKNNNIRR